MSGSYYTASACESCGASITGVPLGSEHALCGRCFRAGLAEGDPYMADPPWARLGDRDDYYFAESGPL